jgi:hypothetical protein
MVVTVVDNNYICSIKCKLLSQSYRMLRLYSGFGALEEELLKAFAAERFDQAATVSRIVTRYN